VTFHVLNQRNLLRTKHRSNVRRTSADSPMEARESYRIWSVCAARIGLEIPSREQTTLRTSLKRVNAFESGALEFAGDEYLFGVR